MLKCTLLVLFILSSVSFAGFDPQQRRERIERKSRQLLMCALDLVKLSRKSYNKDSLLTKADDYLIALRTGHQSIGFLNEATLKCSEDRNDFKNIFTSPKGLFEYQELFDDILKPTATCTNYSMKAAYGFGVALRAGMGASYCKASDGKRFITVTPSIGGAFGGFAMAIYFERSTYTLKDARSFVSSETVTLDGNLSVIKAPLGIRWGSEREREGRKTYSKDASYRSNEYFTLGLAMMVYYKDLAIDIKVIKLMRDYQYLMSKVMIK